MKDHVFRELVNDLRNIAVLYHNHDSLRDKIGGRLRQDIQPEEKIRGFTNNRENDNGCHEG